MIQPINQSSRSDRLFAQLSLPCSIPAAKLRIFQKLQYWPDCILSLIASDMHRLNFVSAFKRGLSQICNIANMRKVHVAEAQIMGLPSQLGMLGIRRSCHAITNLRSQMNEAENPNCLRKTVIGVWNYAVTMSKIINPMCAFGGFRQKQR